MNIGINLFGENKKKAGTGRYSFEVLKTLSQMSEDFHFYIFYPSFQATEFFIKSPRFTFIRILSSSNVFVRRFIEQTLLPLYILWVKIVKGLNVVHSTNNTAPIALMRMNTLTIHDMARWKVKTDTWLKNFFLKLFLIASARVSKCIITVSEASKEDIASITGVAKERILVSLNAIDRNMFFPQPERISEDILKRHSIDISKPFILSLSSIEHRKNFPRLVKAFMKSRVAMDLYICGKKSNGYDDLVKTIANEHAGKAVKIIDFPSDELYVALLNKALFYIFISIFEGAGLTPLEAMACKKAAIVSDLPVFHEYCGDSAFYVAPFDIDSISNGIKALTYNREFRKELETKGFSHVQKFTWKNHAQALFSIWKSR